MAHEGIKERNESSLIPLRSRIEGELLGEQEGQRTRPGVLPTLGEQVAERDGTDLEGTG